MADMNLMLQIDKIEMVMLDDGWHPVESGTLHVGEFSFVAAAEGDGVFDVIASPRYEDQDRLWIKWRERDGSEIAVSLATVRAIRLKPDAKRAG